MGLGRSRRSRQEEAPYWPGFVDALAQFLLVFTFLLSVFMVAQFLMARQIAGQDTTLTKLRAQVAELSQLLTLTDAAKLELQSTLAALGDDLTAEKAKSASLSALLASAGANQTNAGATVSGLQMDLATQKSVSAEALAQVELLNQQVAALRRQIADLSAILAEAEARNKADDVQIADLGRRLNSALALKVQELTRYRSEFFGRLRQILANRPDILVVGDRFVFQSEVLFPKGDATLNPEGREQVARLASAVVQLEKEIPPDINWVLRVDGHTDTDPIQSSAFASNWELSTARAIAVVKDLIALGVDPRHLVAAGFGEFQPLDPGTGEDAKTRNRRIELKLTDR